MATPLLTIPQFVAMIAAGRLQQRAVNHSALEEAAQTIETEAKRVIGTYDYNWQQLAAYTQRERKRLGFPENDPLLRNGRLRNAIEHWSDHQRAEVGVKDATVGTGTKADPVREIGDIAVWMELGTRKAPPRSYLMAAALRKENEVVARIGRKIAMGLFVR
jgi:hypothetical protein